MAYKYIGSQNIAHNLKQKSQNRWFTLRKYIMYLFHALIRYGCHIEGTFKGNDDMSIYQNQYRVHRWSDVANSPESGVNIWSLKMIFSIQIPIAIPSIIPSGHRHTPIYDISMADDTWIFDSCSCVNKFSRYKNKLKTWIYVMTNLSKWMHILKQKI